ncbi:MAG: FadR family transcriptional regulator [Candidatus Tectomicrobia bacterium]|uniref:FadR family transcriptional regulator n=1 Tax=Tectimicrobiota bacterium TaxID=2528274 RepID=A0A932I0D6_UNCTE|nr:FadR family transcriptional regulator [Candidatus Tectomicrobia bacterium]
MLRPVKKTRLYEDVVAQIQKLVRTKKLSPGDKLPSERELAVALGIGRPSVREALRTLDSMGLIEVRSGQGAFLRNLSLDPYLASIRDSLAFLLDVREETLLELWEVRQGLEEQMARLAARRRSALDLERLRGLTGEMERGLGAPEEVVRSGMAFHRALCEAAGNAVLLTVWEAIAGLIEKSQRRIIGVPGQPREAFAKHEALLAAVEAGDAEGARRAMREHMEAEEAHLRGALASARPEGPGRGGRNGKAKREGALKKAAKAV